MNSLFSDAKQSAGLYFWLCWFAIGVGMTLVVVYLSLANIHVPQVPSTIGDKINHLIAYSVLCIWYGQLFKSNLHRGVIAVSLVLLGVLMEVLQGMTVYRHFDLFDACANGLGVLIGLLVLYSGADKILQWLESNYLRVS